MATADVSAVLEAWQCFCGYAETQVGSANDPQALRDGRAPGLELLCGQGLAYQATEHVLRRAKSAVESAHVPAFWAAMGCVSEGATPEQRHRALANALQLLCAHVEALRQLLAATALQALRCVVDGGAPPSADDALLLSLSQRHVEHVAACLTSAEGGSSLQALLQRYYSDAMEEYGACAAPARGESDGEGSGEEMEVCASEEATRALVNGDWGHCLAAVSGALAKLQLQHVSEEAYSAAISGHLAAHLAHSTRAAFSRSVLQPAQEYARGVADAFLRRLLPSGPEGAAALKDWQSRLDYYVYHTVAGLRIRDMFDIVVDYPDSAPAVDDVMRCLRHTTLAEQFVGVFGTATRARLLHAGAATADIIQQYVSTIKAVRHIDPSGVLLQAIGEPIREYLRGRKDTIRCIVTMLTDDGGDAGEPPIPGSLFDELGRGPADGAREGGEGDLEGEEAALAAAAQWQAEPLDSDPSRSADRRRSGDVIGMLVSIYGSKELLINEYRAMLAEKLLGKGDYECEREVRTLELLKLRFGEPDMHASEVMLKDIADSKRLNASVQALPRSATPTRHNRKPLVPVSPLSATVVSALFWPTLAEDGLKLPEQVEEMLDSYSSLYHSMKTPRRLVWRKSLGVVALDITVGDRTLSLSVNPTAAAIIMRFSEQAEWSGAALAAECGLAPSELRRRALYWVNQGVLVESRQPGGDVLYKRAESLPGGPGQPRADVVEEEEMGVDGAGGLGDDGVGGMAVYESYVMGMLSNFDGLPLERIHNMLKMFVAEPPYDKRVEQLGGFLSKLVAEEKLSLEGGVYRKRG